MSQTQDEDRATAENCQYSEYRTQNKNGFPGEHNEPAQRFREDQIREI